MFRIATDADITAPFRYELPTPQIVPVKSGAVSAFSQLAKILDEDIKWYAQHKKMWGEAAKEHRFIFLVHTHELADAEQMIVQALRPFVWLAEIELGIPTTSNYSLYISDIAALGLHPNLASESDFINSQIRYATKIVYIEG